MRVAAPSMIGGAVRAGSLTASGLVMTFSGVGVVCGLSETILAGVQIWSGYCEAADALDAHADKFCAILRMMREQASGTPAQLSLRGKLPWLVLVKVNKCKLPLPNYRTGDFYKKLRGQRQYAGRTFFRFELGSRAITTSGQLIRIVPGR